MRYSLVNVYDTLVDRYFAVAPQMKLSGNTYNTEVLQMKSKTDQNKADTGCIR